jgi:single-stranded-DNA-specific exonuclease
MAVMAAIAPRRPGAALRADLSAARAELECCEAVVPHPDADGLAAAAIALRSRGEGAGAAVLLPRGATPFGPAPPLQPGRLAVLDWGVRDLARRGLLVDHHAPEAVPRADQVLVSGYGEEPEVSTSILLRRLVPDGPPWLAALGAFSDLGPAGLDAPECAGSARGAVRRLAPLVNAARRVPHGPVREALALLVEAADPAAALRDRRVGVLEDARRRARQAFEQAVRTAPVVGDTVALIRFSSPFLVHPLVAEAWRRRLAPRIVLAANDGYLARRVNFAVRGGTTDLRRFLRDAAPRLAGEFAHGHDRATGGSVAAEDFAALLESIGLA